MRDHLRDLVLLFAKEVFESRDGSHVHTANVIFDYLEEAGCLSGDELTRDLVSRTRDGRGCFVSAVLLRCDLKQYSDIIRDSLRLAGRVFMEERKRNEP